MSCIDDATYIQIAGDQAKAITTRGLIDIGATAVIALWQRNVNGKISDLQDEISQRNVALAEAIHAHIKQFWGEESEFVTEAFGESKAKEGYTTAVNSAKAFVASADTAARADWVSTSTQRCLAPNVCDDVRWQRLTQLNSVDIQNHVMRKEENNTQAINDRRYARQLIAIGLGKNLITEAASLSRVAGIMSQSVGEMVSNSAQSLLNAVHFTNARYGPVPLAAGVPALNSQPPKTESDPVFAHRDFYTDRGYLGGRE